MQRQSIVKMATNFRGRNSDNDVNATERLDFSNWDTYGPHVNGAEHLYTGEMPAMLADRIQLVGMRIINSDVDFTRSNHVYFNC